MVSSRFIKINNNKEKYINVSSASSLHNSLDVFILIVCFSDPAVVLQEVGLLMKGRKALFSKMHLIQKLRAGAQSKDYKKEKFNKSSSVYQFKY